MHCYLIMTVLGGDRPGLVRSRADTVAKEFQCTALYDSAALVGVADV